MSDHEIIRLLRASGIEWQSQAADRLAMWRERAITAEGIAEMAGVGMNMAVAELVTLMEEARMMESIWPAPAEGRTVAMEDVADQTGDNDE